MRSRAMAACARVQAASLVCAADRVEPASPARSLVDALDSDPPLTPPAPCTACDASVADRPPPPDPFCVPNAVLRSPRALCPSDRDPLAAVAALRSALAALGVESVIAREGSVGDALDRSVVVRALSDPVLPAAFRSSPPRDWLAF